MVVERDGRCAMVEYTELTDEQKQRRTAGGDLHVLPDARQVLNLAFDRAEEFSPVKNAAGTDSPATCRRDLPVK